MSDNKRLGKGLKALFGDDTQDLLKQIESGSDSSMVDAKVMVEIDKVLPNPYQPRKIFDYDKLVELSQSIASHGLLSPIIVRKSIVGYELIAGERRLRACQLLKWREVPALIVNFNDQQVMELALIENIQRENLSVIEEANAYQLLINKLNYTQEELAKRVGKSRPHITNLLRLLTLPKEVLDFVDSGQLSMGHVRALINVKPTSRAVELAKMAVDKKWSVRQVEKACSVAVSTNKSVQKDNSKYNYPVKLLEKKLSSKVMIEKNKIIISFDNDSDLNRILQIVGAIEDI